MKLHHLEINVSNLDVSYAYYERFFSFLGSVELERGPGYFAARAHDWYLWVNQCSAERANIDFDRYRIGLNHIAFAAPTEAHVQRWHHVLLEHALPVLDPPGEYGPGYFAVYFSDPDGMKLELGWQRSTASIERPL